MSKADTFNIKLESDTQEEVGFDCSSEALILEAAKQQGIYMANYCKQGACGACAAKLVSGSINYVRNIKGAPQEPLAGDEVRPCSIKPCSDLVLEPLTAWRLAGD